MTRSIPAILLLLLASVLALQWRSWPPTGSRPTLDGGQGQRAVPNGATPEPNPLERLRSLEDRDAYASVLERPLFRPDRRPLPPDEATPNQATPDTAVELDQVDLSAVLITPALVSAWIRDPAKPKLVRLRIGDDYSGWSVQEIQEDRVLLERQGERHALILRDYSKAPPTAPASAPASAPADAPPKQRPRPMKARERPAQVLRE